MSYGNGAREALMRAIEDLPRSMIFDEVLAGDTILLLLAAQGYAITPLPLKLADFYPGGISWLDS